MSWVFQESDPMGGAAGEAYANTLKSPGMQPEHVLAREAIQNSVDAGIDGGKVQVRFQLTKLIGPAKTAFVESAGIANIAARLDELELASPNCLSTLEKPRTPLSLLYVEDHNAEGLSGDPHDKGSNFYRLLLSLGDRSKARSAKGTGGSYGFGKSVYSSSSAIQTIFAYTRFVDDEGDERTRLFGCGYYASHEHKGKNYSGRAWLGTKKHEDKAGRLVIDPYEDRQADKLAEKLGFAVREESDFGTTILIVDATVNLGDIITGVEDWWWPRLIEHKLDVEVCDAEGAVSVPRPKRNDQLKPFIEAFEIARGVATPKQGSQKFNPLNRLGETTLGTCGFVVAALNEQGNPIVRSDRCNILGVELESEDDRRDLYRSGMLAFERLRLKEASHTLGSLSTLTVEKLLPLLSDLSALEGSMYRDIVRARLDVISQFENLVDADAKEKVLQSHLFGNLWLLDPGWERAAGSERIEQTLRSDYKDFDPGLNDDESKGRLDIRYKTNAGEHIIVELKRSGRPMKLTELQEQGQKYRTALAKCLVAEGATNPLISIVFVLGKPVAEAEESYLPADYVGKTLQPLNARIVYYDQLIKSARDSYAEYLDRSKKLDRIDRLLSSV